MKIDCPHCGQHIDLEGSGVTEFPCPSCNGYIQLQVKAEAVKLPEPKPPQVATDVTSTINIGAIKTLSIIGIIVSVIAVILIFRRPEAPAAAEAAYPAINRIYHQGVSQLTQVELEGIMAYVWYMDDARAILMLTGFAAVALNALLFAAITWKSFKSR